MRRMLVILALGSAVGACATGVRDGGYATYDALRTAQQSCQAKGGTLKLKTLGDSQAIDSYACERK